MIVLPLALGLRRPAGPIGAKPITALNGIGLYLHVKVYN